MSMICTASIDHSRNEDPSEDFAEEWERQASECPLSDSSWTTIAGSLVRGGLTTGHANALRAYMTVMINAHRTMMPDLLTQLRAFSDANGPIAQTSIDLLTALKMNGDALPSFDLENPDGFLKDLERLSAIAKRRVETRMPASRRRLDRDVAWSQFVDWWLSLELPLRTSLTSPVVAFIVAISEELPWLNIHDRSPENVRAFLRKKARTEQSGWTSVEPEDGEGK